MPSRPPHPSVRHLHLRRIAAATLAAAVLMALVPAPVGAVPVGSPVLVSAAGGGGGDGVSFAPDISDDGRYVVFQSSATDLVAGVVDGNGDPDVFLWDRDSGDVRLVSASASDPGRTGDGQSLSPAISGDGRYVVYTSEASDLEAGVNDPNGELDVVVHDRQADRSAYVSVKEGMSQTCTGSNGSSRPSISDDGAWIAYQSDCHDIVPGQADAGAADADVFLHRLSTRTSLLVSRRATSGAVGNGAFFDPAISGDGATVV